MPHRIILPRIVVWVKPFQLIAALMHEKGLGVLPLAKAMGKPKLQSQIHRFVRGQVINPERTTAVPLAKYFGIPVDAIYEETVATAIANQRGLKVVPQAPVRTRKTKGDQQGAEFDADVLAAARRYAALSAAERQRVDDLMQGRGEQTIRKRQAA